MSKVKRSDPALWERSKAKARKQLGGHSARAMQLAVKLYKDAGGTYKTPKQKDNSLAKWSRQDWQWSGARGGPGVYLPKAKIKRLQSSKAGRAKLAKAAKVKTRATREGRQYARHGLAAGTKNPPAQPYATLTGTRSTLEALADAGWGALIAPDSYAPGRVNIARQLGMPLALDNGAFASFMRGEDWTKTQSKRFAARVEELGGEVNWVVAPDIVAGGADSLALSESWIPWLLERTNVVLLPVQDGMTASEVTSILRRHYPRVGLFLGGTTEWKWNTAPLWGELADTLGVPYHIARVNSMTLLRPRSARVNGARKGINAPARVRRTAAKALERRRARARRTARPGGTAVGIARARDLANNRALSKSSLKRMRSFFARHDTPAEQRARARDKFSPASIAWDLWGGDAGRAWVNSLELS